VKYEVKCAEDNILAEINKSVPIVQFFSSDGWRQPNVGDAKCHTCHLFKL